ncbi:hypothetical protein C8034_v000417 [Colletotrichum sidae]|uniref:Uncharacterized protein n=1 Tax=Colletotrichum sidae TaxID=1347389 RepID=A0A4R8THF5_9PEZI|nr:hypothetical protein C8034_v000417 [Colletotrichum sidae]
MSTPPQCGLMPPGAKRSLMWTYTEDANGLISRQMPIVDSAYHDPDTWEVKKAEPGHRCMAGPPAIDVYCHNLAAGPRDQFEAVRWTFCRGINELMIRLGDLLGKGRCKLHSLNATEFSVTVIVETRLKKGEMSENMIAARLFGSDE